MLDPTAQDKTGIVLQNFDDGVDSTPPVITRLGSSPINLVVGGVYNDAGATALDDTDEDITGTIITVNPVNVNVVGQYVVTYNVDDAAGNSAVKVQRQVNVVTTGTPTDNLLGSKRLGLSVMTGIDHFCEADGENSWLSGL